MTVNRRYWLMALGVAAILGIAIRISNVFAYPIDMGYDAGGNWEYISQLFQSWALPAPDTGWSTAHPPFFYYFAAAIGRATGSLDKAVMVHAIRLVMATSGLLGVWAAVFLVRRADPGNSRRAFFAGALLLFLPVHVYMSAMLTEEVLVTFLMSIAMVGIAVDSISSTTPGRAWVRAAAFGMFAGLALMTKLTGLLIVGAGVAAYLLDSIRSEDRSRMFIRPLVFVTSAFLVGGWYYIWNWVTYGYLYPHGLDVHSVMFSMPPGERALADYLWIPWQMFADPQLLSPDLLRSVWGSTYVTIWFDGHHHFLSSGDPVVGRLGTAMLLLGLVPTAAFAIGLARGARRVLRNGRGPDVVLILFVTAILAGYVLFTWRNPWFAVLKGSFLLGLSVPFSYYASEILADWTRDRNIRSVVLLASLGILAALVIVTFSYGVFFEKHEMPGIQWTPVEAPWQRQ